MTINEIQDLSEQVNKSYAQVNDWMSKGDLQILDLVYPEHDGVEDANAVAEMIDLYFALRRMRKACEISIKKLELNLDNPLLS